MVYIAASGLLSSLMMLVFLKWVTRQPMGNPINVVGSMFGKKLSHTGDKGVIFHCALGITFAFLYYGLVQFFGKQISWYGIVGLTGSASFFHGLIASFFMGVVLVRFHRIASFERSIAQIVGAYLLAHVIYGNIIGISFSAFDVFHGVGG